MPTVVQIIRGALREHADPDYLASLQRLVPGVNAIGVRVPVIRTMVKQLHGDHPQWMLDDVVRAMDTFVRVRRPSREEMLAGTFLLARMHRKLPQLDWDTIEPWIDAIDNWEVCDQLAMNVVGKKLAAEFDALDRVESWASADNPWRRRFSLACTVALNQGGRCHPDETQRILRHFDQEREAIVKKAVTWARKELAKAQSR